MLVRTNQVGQMYVAEGGYDAAKANVTKGSKKISIVDNKDGNFYFVVDGAETLLRSDMIQAKNVTSVTLKSSADLRRNLNAFKITLKDNVVNDGKMIPDDYIINMSFLNFFSISEDNSYLKDAMVRGHKNMTESDFYLKLATSILGNFNREKTKMIEVILTTASDNVILDRIVNKADGTLGYDVYDNTGALVNGNAYTGVIIAEYYDGEYLQGFANQEELKFTVTQVPNYNDDAWCTIEKVAYGNPVGNGHLVADMEWFFMGVRGDMYRGQGYPNVLTTKYLVDPSKEYNILTIHYAFTDTGVNVHRSEKDIIIVSPKDLTTLETAIKKLI